MNTKGLRMRLSYLIKTRINLGKRSYSGEAIFKSIVSFVWASKTHLLNLLITYTVLLWSKQDALYEYLCSCLLTHNPLPALKPSSSRYTSACIRIEKPVVWTSRHSLLSCQNCLSGLRWTSVSVTGTDSTVIPLHRHRHSIILLQSPTPRDKRRGRSGGRGAGSLYVGWGWWEKVWLQC